MKRITKIALAVAFTVGLLGSGTGAAQADSGVAVVTGGTANTNPLVLPGLATPSWGSSPGNDLCDGVALPGATAEYWDDSVAVSHPTVGSWNLLSASGSDPSKFHGCGALYGVGHDVHNVGPACGQSSGHGKGELTTSNGAVHTVTDLHWVSSVGSVFPVTGKAHSTTTNDVVALVRVSPLPHALVCTAGGALQFSVDFVAAVV